MQSEETENYIKKITEVITSKTIEDEWDKGFVAGLGWAIRILNKDKSAY